jgi:hypothetical protein
VIISESGVNVVITISGDFSQKLPFFLKTMKQRQIKSELTIFGAK